MIERRRRFFRGDSLLDMLFSPVPAIPFNLHACSKAQLALSSFLNWPLLHQTIPNS